MEKKWSKQKLIFIPIALLAFFGYLAITFSDSNEEKVTSTTEEGRLEQALGKIQGVGQVKVYFHYDDQEQKNSSSSDSFLNGYFTSNEHQQNLSGLLIIAEGASDPVIQKQLLDTISRVMQMPTHRIMIVPMENKGDEQ